MRLPWDGLPSIGQEVKRSYRAELSSFRHITKESWPPVAHIFLELSRGPAGCLAHWVEERCSGVEPANRMAFDDICNIGVGRLGLFGRSPPVYVCLLKHELWLAYKQSLSFCRGKQSSSDRTVTTINVGRHDVAVDCDSNE